MTAVDEESGAYEIETEDCVAVVGLAGRFPESEDIDAFWDNLRAGRDCLRTVTDEELIDLGIPPEIYCQENFVRRGTELPHRDDFDARFFGYTPKQAALMDPQARIFLETCYEALEAAGYNPFDTGESVGVFAGSNPNDYALLLGVSDPTDSLASFDQMIGVDRDFVATRVSHCLGLTGPAMTIQTACSTSLVTIHTAVQALLAYECSMALAGGVSVNLRQGIGYFYQQGMILSPTGECRAFDADAQGTTLGQGCGAVVLKRLVDAQEANDNILAIVRATATNNDGSNKISYTAPSEDGQAAVIAMAHALAGIESDSIGYVETHGTGTLLGDPIEIAALTRAFRETSDQKQFCAIGSAKTNFGHTDAAAGVTGFIKAVLSLARQEIPPSIHFDKPNPEIDFDNSPFFVNTELRPWPRSDNPRRAGVSAFGIGGTNAHAILEEAPTRSDSEIPESAPRLLLFSAKTAAAADRRVADLADVVERSELALGDVAYTLRTGRPQLEHRRLVVAKPEEGLAATLRGQGSSTVVRGVADQDDLELVWLFAGQGAQYPGMGRGLYERESVFADTVDRTAAYLADLMGFDLRELLFADADDQSAERLQQTSVTQPALFVVENAMAALLRSWGLAPNIVIGHSVGEYAAAVEAGCFSWQDGARLVVERGRLMQACEPGSMLSVPLPAAELVNRLPDGVELAAENAPELCVASGPSELVDDFEHQLAADGIACQPVHTSHAFHSEMMTQATERFTSVVSEISLSPPSVPFVSNVTGDWLTAQEAIDPKFWASQIRNPVLFARCLETAAQRPMVCMELGPGRSLSTFVRASRSAEALVTSTPTMRHPRQDRDDQIVALEAIGRLWSLGVDIDWERIDPLVSGRRVPLPTYPFDRERAWHPPHKHVLALPAFGPPSAELTAGPSTRESPDRWLYAQSWRRTPAAAPSNRPGATVLLVPPGPAAAAFAQELQDDDLVLVQMGSRNEQSGDRIFDVDPADDQGLATVFDALGDREVKLGRIIHAWLADPRAEVEDVAALDAALDRGVHSVLACARAASSFSRTEPVQLDVVSAGAFSVFGDEIVRPEASALAGPIKVIPLEYSGLNTRMIDVPNGLSSEADREAVLAELGRGSGSGERDAVVALRARQRWTPTVAVQVTSDTDEQQRLRNGGRYLILGGLGGVGLSIARYLAEKYQASLTLTSRHGRPSRQAGDDAETTRRIDLLEEIESLATDLDVVAVDVSDEEAMEELFDSIEADGRRLNGVIVAAGVADQNGAIHRRSRADMKASVLSKIHGSLVLERVLGRRQLDFVLLSSSIASVLYHNRFAQVGYVTGNSFVEAFALRLRQRGVSTCTVAWDDWLDIGMSVRAAEDFAAEFGTAVDLVDRLHSFSPREGVDMLERALRSDEPVVFVSTTDLVHRITADLNVVSPFLEQAMEIEAGPEQSADSIEAAVASIWTSLLGYESFQPEDDFFEIGGDSLQAARMADRLSRLLSADVAVDLIFDEPRFAALVAAVENIAAADPQSVSVATSGLDERVVLSPGQMRFLQRGSSNVHHFNTSVLLRPSAPVSEESARRLIADLVRRHEGLRLRVDLRWDDLAATRQRVVGVDQLPDPLQVVDLSGLPSDDATAALSQMSADLQKSMRIDDGPIFGAILFMLPASEQRLLLVTHHLMCDRVSLLLMIDSLQADVTAGAAAGPATSMLEWVKALEHHAAGDEVSAYAARWRTFPLDRVRPLPVDNVVSPMANRNDTVGVVRLEIDSSLVGQTKDRAGRPDELMLAALSLGLATWAQTDAVLIDVLSHGRRLPIGVDVSRAVGMFLTYQTVLIDLAQSRRHTEILPKIREQLSDAWMLDVARFLGPESVQSSLREVPRGQVLFNFVGRAIGDDRSAVWTTTDEDRGPESEAQGVRDHALAVKAEQITDDLFELVFVYSKAAHDHRTIEALAALTSDALRGFAAS